MRRWLVLGALCASWSGQQVTVERRVSGGLLRGLVSKDASLEEYLGIPYARTDREHRFQAPLPVEEWEGVFAAVNEHVRCPQRFGSSLTLGQEDCLTLNVYKPLAAPEPLPVMVFIHGGGFREGSGSPFLYGPEFLVRKGVVLVTINYRVENLGFLCLGIKEAPGNAGLKDQVAALKWVKENIGVFGGDPDNVTIFGESAGAASVAYHLLSPMSAGLYHKAILQSGTAITPWALQLDPIKTASDLAEKFSHIKTEDPHELHKLFMNKTSDELLKARVPRAEGNSILSETIFVPCIEKQIPGVEAFLSTNPFDLMVTGKFNKVPIVIGYNSAEGYMFAGKENETTLSKLDIYKALPRDLIFSNDTDRRKIADEVRKMYLGDKNISKKTLTQLAKFYGDSNIKYSVIATIDLLIKSNKYPVYSYRFSYDGWLNWAKKFFGFGQEPGASHADDIFYMFNPRFPVFFGWLEANMVDRMTTMWTNFAKYSDPTPSETSLLPQRWLPTDQAQPEVFVIDRNFSSAPLFDNNRTLLWHRIYTKYRRKC